LEQLVSGRWGQTLSTSSVLSIGNDQVQLKIKAQAWH